MSGEDAAKAFAQHFYNTFDTNVDGLAGMFVSIRLINDYKLPPLTYSNLKT